MSRRKYDDVRLSEAQRALAAANRGLVYATVFRFVRRTPAAEFATDDLIGDGLDALCRAARRYEEGHGALFSTFAVRCIVNALLRCWPEYAGYCHVPVYAREQGLAAGLPPAVWLCDLDVDMVDMPGHEPEPGAGLEEQEEAASARRRVRVLLRQLPARERKLLCLRYGIGGPPHTLIEAGRIMGFCRHTARLVENRAEAHLRELADQ